MKILEWRKRRKMERNAALANALVVTPPKPLKVEPFYERPGKAINFLDYMADAMAAPEKVKDTDGLRPFEREMTEFERQIAEDNREAQLKWLDKALGFETDDT